jgi:hypothetical protein
VFALIHCDKSGGEIIKKKISVILAIGLVSIVLIAAAQSVQAVWCYTGNVYGRDGSLIQVALKSSSSGNFEIDIYKGSNIGGRIVYSLLGYCSLVFSSSWDGKVQASLSAYLCSNCQCIKVYSGSKSSVSLLRIYLDQWLQQFFLNACSRINCFSVANYAKSLIAPFINSGVAGYIASIPVAYVAYSMFIDILPALALL